MLQLCTDSIRIPLCIIFRNIVIAGIFSDQWKLANMIHINKNNDKQLVSNYRPISLLPICSKIFENIYRYLVANDLIEKHQSGFRPVDSTTNQILYLVHTIHSALDEQKEVHSIFLDKFWHDGLLFKLQQNGIEG